MDCIRQGVTSNSCLPSTSTSYGHAARIVALRAMRQAPTRGGRQPQARRVLASGSDGASANGSSDLSSIGIRPAKDRLAELEAAKRRSITALLQESYNPYRTGMSIGAGSVDMKLYQNAIDSQKRMSSKLSEATAYIQQLEKRLEATNSTTEEAMDFLKKMAMEFGTTNRLAESAAAAVRFGVDKEEAVEKLVKLHARLKAVEGIIQKQRAGYGKMVVNRVPVAWVGVASEVKLMGDFDGWTKGFELSAGNIDSDGVYKTFEANVPLLPGKHRVKLLVDGQWRLASDWATESDAAGETNNVLTVEPKP